MEAPGPEREERSSQLLHSHFMVSSVLSVELSPHSSSWRLNETRETGTRVDQRLFQRPGGCTETAQKVTSILDQSAGHWAPPSLWRLPSWDPWRLSRVSTSHPKTKHFRASFISFHDLVWAGEGQQEDVTADSACHGMPAANWENDEVESPDRAGPEPWWFDP